MERLRGSFGTVEIGISSYLLDATTGERTSTSTSTDISLTTSLLRFVEGNTSQTFTVEIFNEETPEFEETFELVLTVESSTGDSVDGAGLGSNFTSTIRVSENDDPHGLFVISTASVQVAEDVGEGGEEGSGEVVVEREFGDVGRVQVRAQQIICSMILGMCAQLNVCDYFSFASGGVGIGSRDGLNSSWLH